MKNLNTTILQKRDTAQNWATNNPILAEGVLAFDTTSRKAKLGDGVSVWNTLPYLNDDKVDKVAGQGLSDNNYDNTSKDKVDNIPVNPKYTDTIVDISGKFDKSNDTLETYTEKIQATTGIINLSLATVFTDTPSASRTYSITNAKSGVAHSFTLIITMGATVQTLTFPASIKWQGGEIPDLSTASKTYVLTFMTVDGGVNWLGMFGGEF